MDDDAPFKDVPTKASELLAAAQGRHIDPVVIPKTEADLRREARLARPKYRRPRGTKLERVEIMGEVVRKRIAGLNYDEIAEDCKISPATAQRYVDNWVIEQVPAPEQVETLRHVMQERLEKLHATYWHRAMGFKPGTTQPSTEGPQEKSGEFLLKIMDRQAKLMGVDLQPSSTTILVTAESIAAFLGWDDAPSGSIAGVIDVDPREIMPGAVE